MGKRIISLRKGRGLTRSQLATLIGTTEEVLSDIELGNIEIPIYLLIPLSDYLCCTMEYLVKGKEFEPGLDMFPPGIVKMIQTMNEKELCQFIEYINSLNS